MTYKEGIDNRSTDGLGLTSKDTRSLCDEEGTRLKLTTYDNEGMDNRSTDGLGRIVFLDGDKRLM